MTSDRRVAAGGRPGGPATATYVYCVVQARRPRAGRAPAGLPGLGRPRLVDAGRLLWLVVGDAPLARYGEASIARGLRDLAWVSRCAVAHEAVVESWLDARAVVPMKLFTIFESDERALAYVSRERTKLDRVIQRVAGTHEWGVRIRQSSVPAPKRGTSRRAPRPASGAGYLAGKKQARDAALERVARGRTRADEAFVALAAGAVEVNRHPPPGGDMKTSLLLDAAFLVKASRTAQFRAKARRLTRSLKREGCDIELTGPWPPYNFIESSRPW